MKKIHRLKCCAILLAASLLTACGNDVQVALEQAKQQASASESLKIIRKAKKAYVQSCGSRFCDIPDEFYEAGDTYFAKAAKSGDEVILRELYGEGICSSSTPRWCLLQDELRASVLERAKASSNPDLLAAAAAIYGDDKAGVINTSLRIAYLKRAWAAGDVLSAGELARVFARHHQFEDAYFWSLRCVRDCNRQGVAIGESIAIIELPELEKNLSKSQISKLQDRSSVLTNTEPVGF